LWRSCSTAGEGHSCEDHGHARQHPWCQRLVQQQRAVVDSEDYITAQGFVAAGLGIALIPRLGLGGARPDLAVRPLAGRSAGRRIYVGVREGAETTPALRTFVRALRRAAEPRREREPHAL
jgi:DNA-binding transcriptional LysR family regulator